VGDLLGGSGGTGRSSRMDGVLVGEKKAKGKKKMGCTVM